MPMRPELSEFTQTHKMFRSTFTHIQSKQFLFLFFFFFFFWVFSSNLFQMVSQLSHISHLTSRSYIAHTQISFRVFPISLRVNTPQVKCWSFFSGKKQKLPPNTSFPGSFHSIPSLLSVSLTSQKSFCTDSHGYCVCMSYTHACT